MGGRGVVLGCVEVIDSFESVFRMLGFEFFELLDGNGKGIVVCCEFSKHFVGEGNVGNCLGRSVIVKD